MLTTYLLFAIGLKGGAALSKTSFSDVIVPIGGTVILGALIPIVVYNLARKLGKLERADAASLAAHYGSVSAVTFIACKSFLESSGIPFEGYATAMLAAMEVPGIVVALSIARMREAAASSSGRADEFDPGPSERTGLGEAMHEVVTGKSIMLLGGGLLIGALCGQDGYEKVKPFFEVPFQGVLCIFMLEMGLLAATRAADIRRVGAFIVSWGILGPIALGAAGVGVGKLLGLSEGGMTILGTLAASGSYIAAPAAVRVALPNANLSLSLTPAVAITFPFNLACGIPLYAAIAHRLAT